MAKKSSKFQPFIEYLRLLKDVDSRTFAFSEIETIIGKKLCKSAYMYPEYWQWRSSPSHTFANKIKNTGFVNIVPNFENKTVTLSKPPKPESQAN